MSDQAQTSSVTCPACQEVVTDLPAHLAMVHPEHKPGSKVQANGQAAGAAFSRSQQSGKSSAPGPAAVKHRGDRDTLDTYVAITMPLQIVDDKPDYSPVEVGHRGNIYELPRGRRIVVAEGVLSTLQNSLVISYEKVSKVAQDLADFEAAHEMIEKADQRFPSIQVEILKGDELANAAAAFDRFRVRQVSRISARPARA